MSLDPQRLADALREKMLSDVPNATDNEAMTKFCKAIAEAVVEELTTNAEVSGGHVT